MSESETVTRPEELSLEQALEAKARAAALAADSAVDEDLIIEFILPGDDVLGEPVDSMPVVPMGEGEFACQSCFLVFYRSVLAPGKSDICRDCA